MKCALTTLNKVLNNSGLDKTILFKFYALIDPLDWVYYNFANHHDVTKFLNISTGTPDDAHCGARLNNYLHMTKSLSVRRQSSNGKFWVKMKVLCLTILDTLHWGIYFSTVWCFLACCWMALISNFPISKSFILFSFLIIKLLCSTNCSWNHLLHFFSKLDLLDPRRNSEMLLGVNLLTLFC